jgi:uncharacterized protein YjbI with pentapeptide repeats
MMTGEMGKEGRTCDYRKRRLASPCNRPLYDYEHCVFHSKDIEGKKADFEDSFWKEFERQRTQGEKYDFTGFVFPDDISFEEIEFEKDVSFNNAQFSGEAYFGEAQFSGEAYFGEVQFSGEAYFMGAQFYGESYFEAAQFSEGASFWGSQFSGGANFGDVEFHSKSSFTNVIFKDFNQCNMTDTSFHNVFGLLEYIAKNRNKFKHPKGIKYLHDKCKPILGETTVSRLPLLSREIRDDLYLMSFKEKHLKLFSLWWLFADCGRSFLRWALWSLIFAEVFAIIFGFFYYFNPVSFKSEVISFSWPGISLLYYSIVTFTTLGFGDIVPKIPGLQIIIMIEVILGYIMLGGLISILANKLARRS